MKYRLLLILVPLLFSFSAPTKKILLTIGINEFQDSIFKNLFFAVKDAKDSNDLFREHGFDVRTNITGNKAEIISKFEEIRDLNLFEDDTVIIIISTHGTIDYSDGETSKYIVASDTKEKDIKNTAINFNYIIDIFEQLEAKNKALIMCTCYSGVGKSAYSRRINELEKRSKGPLGIKFLFDSNSSLILSSSSYDQKAIEDEKLENDVYLHFLLKNIKSQHIELGYSSLISAHEKSVYEVYEYTDGSQTPTQYGQRNGLNPILISGTPEKYGSKLYQGSVDLDQWKAELDGETVNFKKGLYSVAPGFHNLKVTNKKTNKSFERNVNFKSGSGHNLRNLLVPISLHTITSGYGLLSTSDSRFQSSVKGFSITYQRKEFFRDLNFEMGFFLGSTQEDASVVGITSKQMREMAQAYITTSYGSKLDFLSKTDRTLDTELSLGVGLTGSHTKIDRENDSFYKRTINSYSLGPRVQSEVKFKTHHHVKFGARFEASYLPDLKNVYGWHTFLGVFW